MELNTKKPFKYYAIRIGNTLVFRRTVNKINKVSSLLYKPNGIFRLQQVTYTGGKVMGCASYDTWLNTGGRQIAIGNYKKLDRSIYKAFEPYITKN